MKLTTSEYIEAARRIEHGSDPLPTVRVHILATFTADILRPYLIVEGAARGLRIEPSFGPFNQLEQQVFDVQSPLYGINPSVVVIAARLEDLAPRLVDHFVTLDPARVNSEIDAIAQRMEGLVEGIRNRSNAKIILWNFVEPRIAMAGLAGALLEQTPASVLQRANDALAKIARARPDVVLFDCARLALEIGLDDWCDQRMFHLGRIPFGSRAQMAIAKRLARTIRAAMLPQAKCLVLDLDNTLWGGVVGEDGLAGIQLGEDFPGNVFKEFQRYLHRLKQRGVLLAIASKNNEADAWEAIDAHQDMILRRDDFAAVHINWNDKASSLRAIARDLNIGMDALAFFDDNPVEREWIRSQAPEVRVIDVPEQPLQYIGAIEDSGWFDQLVIVAEDLRKADQYREQRQREHLQTSTQSVDEFLRELGTSVIIGAVSRETLPRFAQLLVKTNQFNLTTRRHSAAQIEAIAANGGLTLWLRARDRFGDHGLVGAAIAIPESGGTWRIDTFLMSCRVIGRRIETALLATLASLVRRKGGERLVGEYIPTGKNGMVAELFPSHGFSADGDLWLFDLTSGAIAAPDSVEITVNEEPSLGK